MASPWLWSLLDVRYGLRSLVRLFLRTKLGKMEFLFLPELTYVLSC